MHSYQGPGFENLSSVRIRSLVYQPQVTTNSLDFSFWIKYSTKRFQFSCKGFRDVICRNDLVNGKQEQLMTRLCMHSVLAALALDHHPDEILPRASLGIPALQHIRADRHTSRFLGWGDHASDFCFTSLPLG